MGFCLIWNDRWLRRGEWHSPGSPEIQITNDRGLRSGVAIAGIIAIGIFGLTIIPWRAGSMPLTPTGWFVGWLIFSLTVRLVQT